MKFVRLCVFSDGANLCYSKFLCVEMIDNGAFHACTRSFDVVLDELFACSIKLMAQCAD